MNIECDNIAYNIKNNRKHTCKYCASTFPKDSINSLNKCEEHNVIAHFLIELLLICTIHISRHYDDAIKLTLMLSKPSHLLPAALTRNLYGQ